jgi:predicted 2-oxoglutarate/Fe(II)-dependent dioxygenase YbiX
MKPNKLASHIYTIDNFWTTHECIDFIAKSEDIGYEPAKVGTANVQVVMEGVRNNERVIYKDMQLADSLWQQLKPYAPEKIGNSIAVGLNELFRFYKYQPGQKFKKHRDQSYVRENGEASYYTFMIYLNDNYKGGETTFNDIVIKPKQGMALLFFHDLEHEGSAVMQGIKYVLRTDVMFRFEEEND